MNRSLPVRLFCLLSLALVASPSVGRGSVIYTYEGVEFTEFGGGGYFVPGDRVTGFVEFATAPMPNTFLEGADIEAFELSVGGLVVTDLKAPENRWFFVDEAGQIALWDLAGVDHGTQIFASFDGDFANDGAWAERLGAGGETLTDYAFSNSPGTWRLQSVPEPASVALWSVALGVVGFCVVVRSRRGRGRRASGRPDRTPSQ